MNVVYAGNNPNSGLCCSSLISSLSSVGTYAEAIFKVASGGAELVLVDSQSTCGGTETQFKMQVMDLSAKYVVFRPVQGTDKFVEVVDSNIGLPHGTTSLRHIVEEANRGK